MGGNARKYSNLVLDEKDDPVIVITRTNGTKLYINPELIQTVEATPDTVITLAGNKIMIVKESPREVADRYIEYRRKTLAPFALSDTK